MPRPVNPLAGDTIDRRAVCGRSARTVRREGEPGQPALPTPIGDYSLKEAPAWVKFYGVFLMLCGAAIVTVLFSLVTDGVLQLRFRDFLGRRRGTLRNHVIVAGLGKIGYRLVQDLVRNGESVVAIERRSDAEFVQAARERVPVIIGNAKASETLRKAGVIEAKAVLAVTDDDLANLSIGLATRRASATARVVLRIFDATLAEKMEQGLGVDAVLSVSGAAAPTLIGSVLCREVRQGIVLGSGLVLVFHRQLEAGTSSAGASGCPGEQKDTLLWVKPAGAARYRRASASYRPAEGDQVLGVRCYPLQPVRCGP